jgi:hypothetical protein
MVPGQKPVGNVKLNTSIPFDFFVFCNNGAAKDLTQRYSTTATCAFTSNGDASFDGSGTKIVINGSPARANNAGCYIIRCVMPNDLGSFGRYIVGDGAATAQSGWSIAYIYTGSEYRIRNYVSSNVCDINTGPDRQNTPATIVVRRFGSEYSCYINGSSKYSSTTALVGAGVTPVVIGRLGDTYNNFYFNKTISFVAFTYSFVPDSMMRDISVDPYQFLTTA